jgi:hypothetical protein
MRRLYRSLCRRWCPGGLTLSALAYKRAQAGYPWWRDRIDGFFLLFAGQHQHCQADYQRGRP